jgi:mevalonate kinase
MINRGISHGKIILSGEHSVVYGYPALAFPIDLTTTVTLLDNGSDQLPIIKTLLSLLQKSDPRLAWNHTIKVISTIPVGSGLGSSAALAHALIQALGRVHELKLSRATIFNLVQECEKHFHGRPSGIDAATVVYGKPVRMQRVRGEPVIAKLPRTIMLPPHQLLYSGSATESTKEMVEQVAALPDKERILAEIGVITEEIEQQLRQGSLDLNLITANERLLEKLGVVGDQALAMIKQIERNGGYAKIVGAGGKQTGSGMILAFL